MDKELVKLVNELLDYIEDNLDDVLLEYVLMTWFIAQDKKRQKEYDKLRNEVVKESEAGGF